jgi:hypothetical protein
VTIVGVDAGSRSLREADHLIHDLVGRLPVVVAGTHLIRGERPRVAVSLEFDGPWTEELPSSAEAVAQHGVSGRAVVFPGSASLTGVVRVGDVLANSAIARFQVIGGPDQPGPNDLLDTRDHVRPEWQHGELVLAVTPAGPGRYAPFEVPNPTPCCADHD